MNNRDLIFVDVETTGLDCAVHEVIEVAWVITTPDAKTIKEKYHARMMPQHLERAQPRALEVNGFTKEAWEAGPLKTHAEVAQLFAGKAARKVMVGQNVGFDEGFFKEMLRGESLEPSWHYQKVDTCALAWPFYAATDDLNGVSLEKLCAFLSIPQERKHSADADVMSCYYVYLALMNRLLK